MNKFFVIIILFFSILNFGQSYHFNFLMIYDTQNLKTKTNFETVNYFNTEDYTYYLKVNRTDNQRSASLFDGQKKLIHIFNVIQSKNGDELQFSYQYSKYYFTENRFKNYKVQLSEVKMTPPNKVSLKIFPNKRTLNPILEQTLTLEKSKKNLWTAYRLSMLNYLPPKNDLKFPEFFVVTKSVENYKMNTCEITLKESEDVNFEIVIQENLIKKRLN